MRRESSRKYKDKLGKTLKGKPQDLFLQAFKALADKKVSSSGAQGGFRSGDKRNAIKCSVKANEGLLYPLERSLFFIPKPPIHVHFDEIACALRLVCVCCHTRHTFRFSQAVISLATLHVLTLASSL